MARSGTARLPADAAPVFAALGDPTRLRLVARLCDGGPLSISRLAEGVDMSRQAATKHLQALEGAGIVRSARAGRERIWQVRTARLTEMRDYLQQISDHWDAALARLRREVETDDT
ncbi:MAG TPA: metalloregulator ArsR/SmtB family transcription factor [Acetobacteraceae bacterium]|jgi:DNA-binding transcriptional ArsR family regulator|nr:metalloregulator ArsR/SmtB family transcription factor [Acetobacteraceae bacterium]